MKSSSSSILLISFISTTIMLASPSLSYSQYTVVQLTNNASYDTQPKINTDGHVVWQGDRAFPGYGIWLYDGSATTQLSASGYPWPQINNNGYVVWAEDAEIVLFNGTSINQITDDDYDDSHAQINDNGDVVWVRWDEEDAEIVLFNGTSTTQLTNNDYDDFDPRINDNGDVVWAGCDGSHYSGCSGGDWEIFLYNGTSTTQLTDNDYDDEFPQINNTGYVVWHGGPAVGGYEIFLYDGTSTTQLTNNDYSDGWAQLNDNGHVVWMGFDGSDPEIFLYDGTNTTQLTNNDYWDYAPQINNTGYVVWHDEPAVGGYEIFLYDGTSTTQLTSNNNDDWYPQISDNGYVAWEGCDGSDCFGGDGDFEIFLAVPCSSNDDNDGDGYVSDACGGDDCHDSNPNIYPTNPNTYCNCNEPYPQGTDEICGDGADNDCNGTADDKDQDGDGYIDEECEGNDCDDSNPNVNPGATEACDGLDNDCDGSPAADEVDGDSDDVMVCEGDCDDFDPDVYPDAPEICDGVDNQCPGDPGYGKIDETGVCDPTPCSANAAASTYDASPAYGPSDLGKHLAYFLLPIGAVITLRILRRKR